MIRLMTASLDLSLASLQALALMFSSRLLSRPNSQTKVHTYFVCFADFSKAFDRVNYWTLFNKLLDDNVNCKIVRILAAWYSTQTCSVKWGGVRDLS